MHHAAGSPGRRAERSPRGGGARGHRQWRCSGRASNGAGRLLRWRGVHPGAIPKIKIEVLAPAEHCEWLVGVVGDAARTGEVGDGKVWVVAVESVLRIRTGEVGREAV
ncbi:MAG: P-II family nitrogen regulator [candidate division WS1 bacterium]|nr:P-II family nitrogen regulator [candidate division WS1 bacterium]